jgi:hypothetical protein
MEFRPDSIRGTAAADHPVAAVGIVRRRGSALPLAAAFGLWVWAGVVGAGEVVVLMADFQQEAAGWRVAVTLRHADTGWDHYADAWRVVGEGGGVLGTRVLYHPHVDEQPFTRSLSGVSIPAGAHRVYVTGHDKVHGWGPRLAVDLDQAAGPGFRVSR